LVYSINMSISLPVVASIYTRWLFYCEECCEGFLRWCKFIRQWIFLVLNEAVCHEDFWWNGIMANVFLTLALDGNTWSVPCCKHLDPQKRSPADHWIGDWVHLATGLDAVQKKNVSTSARN
jgi:hypothetical protein